MKVRVNVNGLDIAVSVGDGEQSLTWLAMVASQQYELRKPAGRSRVREPSFSKRGFFLPESIMSSKEEILDPKTKVRQIKVNELEIEECEATASEAIDHQRRVLASLAARQQHHELVVTSSLCSPLALAKLLYYKAKSATDTR